jgi:ubiquinone/menaquinone biosynthesis C-methylase UbiE
MDKPPHLKAGFADRFKDTSVAQAYRSRPPYPPETFNLLSSLITDEPRIVLDVGCGTGNIARFLAPLVDLVEAVDISGPMIEVGKQLPGGDRPNIVWKTGRIEEVELQASYSLIVGAQSLHWTDWDAVFPRFRRVLSEHGYLAVVDLDSEPLPWKAGLEGIIKEFSTNPDYRPYDMVAEWQRAGVFCKVGERKTSPVPFKQPLRNYLEFLHSVSSLTRRSMGKERASKFDSEVTRVAKRYLHGSTVESMIFSSVVWGTLVR